MANPSRSLNNLVSWSQVLPVLGVADISATILPATTNCPICQGTGLRVFDDTVVGGQWVFCRQCGFAGDLIELAGKIWTLDISETLTRLSDLNLVSEPLSAERVAAHIRDHVHCRRRFHEFWTRARQRPIHTSTYGVRQVLRRFGLLDQTNDDSWLRRGGRFVGTADFHEVQDLFAPLSYAKQPRVNRNGKTTLRRGAGPGRYRLFKGHGWDEVLVFPFQDLPGRISGFLFIGRDADPDVGDVIFKVANYQPNATHYREAGLGMREVTDEPPHPMFGNVLVVITDPLVALQLQGRALRDSITPLPIVTSYFDTDIRTHAPFANLPGTRVVFWGRDTNILREAKAANAEVSLYPISDKEIQRRLPHHLPIQWLQLILKHAVPWTIALRQQLEVRDLATAEAILHEMEFSADELRLFVSRSSKDLQERLAGIAPLRLASRRLSVGGKVVVESDIGWRLEESGEVISNAAIRIEEFVQTSKGSGYYRGTVRLDGQEIGFCFPITEVDRHGLFPLVRDLLLEHDIGCFQYRHDWVKHSAFIAMTLGQPKCRTGVDRIGWYEKEQSFVFPRFAITRLGTVRYALPPLVVDNPPAAHLAECGTLAFLHNQVEALSTAGQETSLLWSMAACIVHNLLVPAIRYQPAGILLDGIGAEIGGTAIAKVLGCLEIDWQARMREESALDRLDVVCTDHDWPAIVRMQPGRSTRTLGHWAHGPGPKNAIVMPGSYAALALATNPGFHLVTCSEPVAFSSTLRAAATKFIPNYLQDLCSRRRWINLGKDGLIQAILQDMADWFQREGGDKAAVLRAREILWAGVQQPWRAFMELLFRLYEEDHVQVVRAGYEPRRPAVPRIVYHPAQDGLPPSAHVPLTPVNRLLNRMGLPGIDCGSVRTAAEKEPALLSADSTGLCFEAEWWTAQYREHYARKCQPEDSSVAELEIAAV